MLSKEQNCILMALSDHLYDKKTEISEDISPELLENLAVSQQIGSILFYQTRLPSLRSSFASAAYHAVNRRNLLGKLHELFSAARIPYLIFKGTEISAYYPHPELRSMGDIDILVHSADKKKAGEVLEQLGFSTDGKEKPEDHEWVYRNGDNEIELHHRLLYDDNMNDSIHVAFTDRAWEHASTADGIQYHLTPEFHFAYLLLHLRKHLLWSGIGIRQFLDLAVMIKNADMDWDCVESYLSQLGLCEFSEKCFGLIAKWFGITAPILTPQISDDFYEAATKAVSSDGIFGKQDHDSMVDNSVMNTTRKRGRIRPALSVLFPPYRQMKEKYPKMAKSPLLLPIMWVRRMVESLFRRSTGDGLHYAAKYLVKSSNIREREAVLKSWGLQE